MKSLLPPPNDFIIAMALAVGVITLVVTLGIYAEIVNLIDALYRIP